MHLLKHFYEQKLIRKMLSKDLLMINIIRIDPEMKRRIQCTCLVQSLAEKWSTSLHRCYIWHCRRHVSTLYRKENHYISVVLSVSFFSTWNTLVINVIIRNNLHRSKRKHCCNDFLKTERNILFGIFLTNWNMTLEEISAW